MLFRSLVALSLQEMRKQMFGIVSSLEERLMKKSITFTKVGDGDELGGKGKQSEEDSRHDKNIFKKGE